jgi:hypothetical protein
LTRTSMGRMRHGGMFSAAKFIPTLAAGNPALLLWKRKLPFGKPALVQPKTSLFLKMRALRSGEVVTAEKVIRDTVEKQSPNGRPLFTNFPKLARALKKASPALSDFQINC